MLEFGKKGTIDGFTFLEVNRFVPKLSNKAGVFSAAIEFDVFYITAYVKHEKRLANWVITENNIATYEFKYRGTYYKLKINQNNTVKET